MKVLPHVTQVTAPDAQDRRLRLPQTEEGALPPNWLEARELMEIGEYERARLALSEQWPLGSARPCTDGLDPNDTIELLLLAGAINSCLGLTGQYPGAQADVKELIAESIHLSKQAGLMAKAAEGRSEMAWYLSNEGDSEAALALNYRALEEMGDGRDAPRAKLLAVVRAAIFEYNAGHLAEMERVLSGRDALVAACGSHALQGKFHNIRAILYSTFGEDGHGDFLDRALIEYEAAGFHFKEAGAPRRRAPVENNLGLLLITPRKFKESAGHLKEARALVTQIGDKRQLGHVAEAEAQLCLAEGRNKDAVSFARESVRLHEATGGGAALAEAQTTLGVALARVGLRREARATLACALKVAVKAGAWGKAGLASLAALEEFGGELDFDTAWELYVCANSYFCQTARPGRMCVRLGKATLNVFMAARARDRFAGGPAAHAPVGDTAKAFSLMATARRLLGDHPSSLIVGMVAKSRRALASYVHELSGRKGRFVAFNCRNFEGESYTPKRFAEAVLAADGGTLVLEWVEDLPGAYQQRVLRLLRDGMVEVEGAGPRHVDVRVLAGATRDLRDAATDQEFSTELYEQLRGPGAQRAPSAKALKEARVLASSIIKESVECCYPKGVERPPEVETVLRAPADVAADVLAQQLAVAFYAAASQGVRGSRGEAMATVAARFASADGAERIPFDKLVGRFEAELIRGALRTCGGSVTKAADVLGVSRQTLTRMVNKDPELKKERTPAKKRRRS